MKYLLKKEDRTATISSYIDNRFMNYRKEFGSTIIENVDITWTESKRIILELENLGYQHYSASFKHEDRIAWYKYGRYHRDDGPAVEWNNGSKMWYKAGALHRADGPAITNPLGDKEWYFNGNWHREDGPAIECRSGKKVWYIHGILTRLDGPAVEYSDGRKEFWINGDMYEYESDFWKQATIIRSEN